MKIVCIGRNYHEHIKELNNDIPDKPLFFIKPDNALLNNKSELYLPDFSSNIHYELEFVVKIHKVGKHIKAKFAKNYYSEIGLGLDLTARDLQAECKAKSWPWELAKGFDSSAPVGRFIPLNDLDINNLNFTLDKNGSRVQTGNTKDMIHSVDQFIEYVTQFITLKKGDLIFTGTPAGVGQVSIGDEFLGCLEGEELMRLKVK
ncbi:MAG: fumarylacetoacetate hydrolase family protein [Flavobacteriales bacterium]